MPATNILIAEWPRRSQEFLRALEAWAVYYVDCEAFDAKVCAARRDGVAFPVTARERAVCMRFARMRMRRLDVETYGIRADVVQAAKHEAERLGGI